jgi:type II secretory pathway component GspD/PulD (secretin)
MPRGRGLAYNPGVATLEIQYKTRLAQNRRRILMVRVGFNIVLVVALTLPAFADDAAQKGRTPKSNAVPVSALLLVSSTPQSADEVSQIISQLDARPPSVMLNIVVAELLPRSRDSKGGGGLSGASAAEKAPSMKEDGAAWLAWAAKHGRLDILQRPQVWTLDNQPAVVEVGTTVPIPVKGNEVKQETVGLRVGLTPRISPEGNVLVALDVERGSLVDLNAAAGPTIKRTTVQTSVWAKDGQTIVVSAWVERDKDGEHQMIVAVTPHVNPTKR